MPSVDELTIPLLQFSDIDGDGMTDAIYYHQNSIIVLYNQLKAKVFNSYTLKDTGESLCFKPWELLNKHPIYFKSFVSLKESDVRRGGNNNVSI
jgi:hypothetical protein